MLIPVIKKGEKGDRGQKIIWLDINDVTHLLRKRNEIEFHTAKGVYVFPNALEYWKDPLQQYDFDRLDWSLLVNLNKIVGLDEKQQVIYFENQLINKGLTIAKIHISRVKDYLTKRDE